MPDAEYYLGHQVHPGFPCDKTGGQVPVFRGHSQIGKLGAEVPARTVGQHHRQVFHAFDCRLASQLEVTVVVAMVAQHAVDMDRIAKKLDAKKRP